MMFRRHSYDRFLVARTVPTRVQFWGFLILGASLVVTGFALLLMFVSRFSLKTISALDVLTLMIPLGICGAIVYFGLLHIKRALVGGHRK